MKLDRLRKFFTRKTADKKKEIEKPAIIPEEVPAEKPVEEVTKKKRSFNFSKRVLIAIGKFANSSEKCWCGIPLVRNNNRQIVHYCCKSHRIMRHHTEKEKACSRA